MPHKSNFSYRKIDIHFCSGSGACIRGISINLHVVEKNNGNMFTYANNKSMLKLRAKNNGNMFTYANNKSMLKLRAKKVT